MSSEELIKYAHRISASSAVAAPHNWQQGDPRRPYPTDIEMRQGFLGRMSDLPLPPTDANRPLHGKSLFKKKYIYIFVFKAIIKYNDVKREDFVFKLLKGLWQCC